LSSAYPGLSSNVLLVITLCRKAALDRVVLALLPFFEVSEMIQNSWRDSLRYTTSMFVSCCVELGKKIILSSLSALKMFRASTRGAVTAFLSYQQPEYPSVWHMKWKFVGRLPNCTQRGVVVLYLYQLLRYVRDPGQTFTPPYVVLPRVDLEGLQQRLVRRSRVLNQSENLEPPGSFSEGFKKPETGEQGSLAGGRPLHLLLVKMALR
jgi:hypothetical protein